MTRILTKPGNILTALLALLALGGIYAIGMTAINANRPAYMPKTMAPLTDQELEVTLLRAGLSPEACCAAGLNAQQTDALIDRARTHMETAIDGLRTADETFMSAKASHDQLRRLVQAGNATQQDIAALTDAKTAFNTAATDRQARLDAAYTEAVEGLEAAPKLDTLSDNSGHRVPAQYRIVTRSEAQWVALRRALADVRIAADLGEDPPQESVDLIAQADSDQAVSAAATSLELNLDAVAAAWNTAIYGDN